MHELALDTAIPSGIEEVHQKERELEGLDREVIRDRLEAGVSLVLEG